MPPKNLPVGYYIICLIDILGQKERLKAWDSTDHALTPEFINCIKKTAGTVAAFMDHIQSFFKTQGIFSVPEKYKAHINNLSAEKQYEIANVLSRISIKKFGIQQFSDTFVLYSPLMNEQGDLLTDSFYSLIQAAAMLMQTSLAGKTPVRGAIHIGKGMELDDSHFYGPALAEVYRLESTKAGGPRIILSDEALDLLLSPCTLSEDPTIDQILQTILGLSREMIFHDHDKLYAVDFAGKLSAGLFGASSQSFMTKMISFANQEKDKLDVKRTQCQERDRENLDKLYLRYNHLVNYLDNNIHFWM